MRIWWRRGERETNPFCPGRGNDCEDRRELLRKKRRRERSTGYVGGEVVKQIGKTPGRTGKGI